MSDTNWNDVGDKIKDAVDSAISTGDFSNLSRSIGDVINDTIDNVKDSVKTAAQQNKKTYSANPYYKTIHTESAPEQPQPPTSEKPTTEAPTGGKTEEPTSGTSGKESRGCQSSADAGWAILAILLSGVLAGGLVKKRRKD